MSDPFQDHSIEYTSAVLAKSDSKLIWSDYQSILGPHLPAGTYAESVYFLPLAFEYIVSHDDEALDLVTAIFGFASKYADDLDSDGQLTAARACIAECLDRWTKQFIVTHYDRSACEKKQWVLEYCDLVNLTEVICEGTCDLIRFERHADIAVAFYRKLAENKTDPVKAAWFLELARAQCDVYRPPAHPIIGSLLNDRALLQSAVETARSLISQEPSPTYWNDTLKMLRLTRGL